MLKIEKFVDGKLESSTKIPNFVPTLGSSLLPEAAHAALLAQGIDLRAMVQAARAGAPFSATVTVREEGVDKQVVLSIA